MALTEQKKQEILEILKTKIQGSCPMCGTKHWTMQDELVGTNTVSVGGGTSLGGPFVPMLQLICNHCGFVSHHAAGLLGIKLK